MNKSLHKTLTRGLFPLGHFFLVIIFFYGNLMAQEVLFVKNEGQWENHIEYKALLNGGYAFLEQDKITYVISEEGQIPHAHVENHLERNSTEEKKTLGRFSYQVQLKNSRGSIDLKPEGKESAYHNYLLGTDPGKWKTMVPLYKAVRYAEVYDDIDLQIHSKSNLLEYDFIVKQGGDVNDIRMKYEGVEEVKIKNEQLHIKTKMGVVTELAPIAYRSFQNKRTSVQVKFRLFGENEVGFETVNDVNNSKGDLIIDPVLVFSTYTGSTADNWGFTATYDNEGNLYSGGMVVNQGYPTTIGSYDTIYNGGVIVNLPNGQGPSTPTDIAISKFSKDGKNLLYSTFIGGSANELPHSLIVNDQNELIIYGTTGSFDYPITLGAHDVNFNGGPNTNTAARISYPSGSDIVITKLNAEGSALLGSTFFGGSNSDGLNNSGSLSLEYNYGDFARGDVALDENGDIYIATCTYSTDIPNTTGSIGATAKSGLNGCVARFNSDLTQLKWASYIGGNDDDAAFSIEIGSNGEIIIGGGTRSLDFEELEGFHNTYRGGHADGFLMKITPDGTASEAGTYIGTNAYDQAFIVEIDNDNNIYALGQTLGNYPVSEGAHSNINATQFIHKFSNDLTSSEFSTVFGSPYTGSQIRRVNISPTAFLVDKCENLYAVGWGGAVNVGYNTNTGNTNNMEVTNDAFSTLTDGSDFYIMVLNSNASSLQYASYFGELGNGNFGFEHLDGGTSRFDKNGFVYHAVCASCGGTNNFPTTEDAWSRDNGSGNCNLAAFKFEFDLSPLTAAAEGDPISGCPPLEVQFQNTSNKEGKQYFWDFDEGNTSNLESPTHLFTEVGVYNVQFIIVDSSNCVIADTTYLTVTVGAAEDSTKAQFLANTLSCVSQNVAFINQSENADNFLWNFGDGTTSSLKSPNHSYISSGTYTVSLVANPGSLCSDTAQKDIIISENSLLANFESTIGDCSISDGEVSFTDLSTSNQVITAWQWNFGDGNTSNSQNPTHTFERGNNYIITLFVEDAAGCQSIVSKQIGISEETIKAGFEVVIDCQPFSNGVQFSDTSTGISAIIGRQWNFGDGNTSMAQNPTHFYAVQGNYIVSLIVFDAFGCFDTIEQEISVFNENINLNINVEPLICNSTEVQFINNSTSDNGISQWLWNFGDGDSSTLEAPSHTYDNLQNWPISVTAVSNTGCRAVFNANLPLIYLEIDFDIEASNACNPIEAPINFNVSSNSSNNIIFSRWDFGDGTVQDGLLNTNHQYTNPGIYTVRHIGFNQHGCSDTTTKIISIPEIIDIRTEAFFEQDVCAGDELKIDFSSTIESNDSIASVVWKFGDGMVLEDTLLNPSHIYADTGVYNVSLIVISELGCSDTFLLEVQVIEIPTINLIDSIFICRGDSIVIPLQFDFEPSLIQWFPTTYLSQDSVKNPIAFPPETATFSVDVVGIQPTGDTCYFNESITIVVRDSLNINADVDQNEVIAGTTVQLMVDEGLEMYHWMPGNAVSDSTIFDPTATILNDITFYIIAIDSNGCVGTDSVSITTINNCNFESLYIPNAFTPNGDGTNDVLYVRINQELDRLDFSIYNRWGQRVFSSDNIDVGWDGRYNGQLQSTDVFGYYLEIECAGETITKKGNITLVR